MKKSKIFLLVVVLLFCLNENIFAQYKTVSNVIYGSSEQSFISVKKSNSDFLNFVFFINLITTTCPIN